MTTREPIPSPVGFRTLVIAEDGETVYDLVLTIQALCQTLVDDYKVRGRALSCVVHTANHKQPKSNTQPTLCPICALVDARIRYRGRVLKEYPPVR